MFGKSYRLCTFLHILVCGFLLSRIFFTCASAQAESNKEVRVAIDQLKETLINTTKVLKGSQNSSTNRLKTAILESLDQVQQSLNLLVTALDTIKDQQDRRVDNDQLYCIMFPGNDLADSFIDTCYLASNPNNRFSKSLNSIRTEGWHLTSLAQSNGSNRVLAVYSKYLG